ncbi:VanW family protein [Propionibacteriaceae bacterium G1746]
MTDKPSTNQPSTSADDPTREFPIVADGAAGDGGERPARKGRKGLVIGSVVGGLIVLTGAAYVAGYAMAGDKTPKNTSVQGVAIGGLTHEQAVTKLNTELGASFNTPITLSADGKSVKITPSEAGMTVDFDATVDKAGAGKSWNPAHIWNVLSGGQALAPVTEVDETKVAAAVAKAAPTFAVAGKDATIAIDGVKVVTTESTQKVELDQKAATTAVADAWRTQDTVAAPLVKTDPAVTTDEVNKVKADYADKALSGPVTVKVGDKSFPIDVKTIAGATSFKSADGNVTAATDMQKIWAAAQKSMDDLGLDKGKEASFRFEGGRPVVVPSADGVGVDKDAFLKLVQPALTATGAQRTVTVPVTKKTPELSTDAANKLGVKEVIGEFTTEFPYAEYRNTNLSVAAARLNGQLVKPGEIFSMNDTLGQRTAANGYVDGYVIQGPRLVKETGGGVSQSATTVFNAIFFAGLKDVEHHPHTLYFSRYPAGREATLYYGSLDLKFQNDTNYGVVIQAYVNKAAPGTMGSITVKIWSTKTWDKVESTALNKTDPYDTAPITSDAENCEPQAASPGFTVNYERLFYRGGQIVKREPFSWKYSATPKVTCSKG